MISGSRFKLEHRYTPRGAARELFRIRADEVLMSGPAGTGKSRACMEKLNMMALLNPGMRGLIVRKTAASLGSTALVTWREKVIFGLLRVGDVYFHGGSAEKPPEYRYENGSTVAIGGMDKPSKIMSSEYDVVYVQEATELTKDDWEAIISRLRNGVISFQQLIADCNPSKEKHWLKVRCDAGPTRMLYSKHEDNPVYYNEDGTLTEAGRSYIEGKLDNLTGVRYQRLRLGKWASAEGVVYEDWDESVHLIDAFEVPQEWPRFWSIDFGYTNPFVCQMWAEDPDGRLILYREFYRTKRLVEDHVADILSVVAPGGIWKDGEYIGGEWIEPRPTRIIADHDAEDRATFTRKIQMSTHPAKKSVSDGIQAVQSRLKVQPDGKPRLMIMRDCRVYRDPDLADAEKPTCTAEEVGGYIYPPNSNTPGNTKEAPVKEDDHGCDGMRYIVADRDLVPKPKVRFM